MNKHTPGNWYVSAPYVMSDHEGVIEGTHTVVGRATNLNDALLIAATPELLEVAKLAIVVDSPEDMAALFDLATKAIAKAKGE